jgi:hypothetical protein
MWMTLINPPLHTTLCQRKDVKDHEVADTIIIATHIMHDQPIPLECAAIKVTMIRESREFRNLD